MNHHFKYTRPTDDPQDTDEEFSAESMYEPNQINNDTDNTQAPQKVAQTASEVC
jgi:hypothetical protein